MSDSTDLIAALKILAYSFILIIGLLFLIIIIMFIVDISQSKHAIRKNYPVIGRFRYFFEDLGKFFRQYFYAMDREELPFNRADRSWVYRASKDVDNSSAFGSTRDLKTPGTILFVNSIYPCLDSKSLKNQAITIGEYCQQPYTTNSIFNISAMSFGAISEPAVIALSQGASLCGCWLNTGEGGLSSYHLQSGADLVFQIGTAKYGVRDNKGVLSEKIVKQIAAHTQVKMFEIKLSQGAKPGKGGILPAAKVTEEIAKIRGIEVGKASISPNRHSEINNENDLLDLVEKIRTLSGKPVGIKTVIGDYQWLHSLCNAIIKRGLESAPDFITVDSADGGTGAAPTSLIDYVGLPIRESLPRVVDILKKYDLYTRIKVIASGRLITPGEIAWALCVGAHFVCSARGFMFALGCIQAMQCNKNTCPTGVTTHNKRLQKGLDPVSKSIRVKNYVKNTLAELDIIAHSCGVQSPRDLSRQHARMVTQNNSSLSLTELYKNN